jgi:hypothetical protein
MFYLFPSMNRIKRWLSNPDKQAQADEKAKRALWLGITAVIILLIPEITIMLSLPLGILAIRYGKRSLDQGTRNKKMAGIGKTLGLISIIGFVLASIFTILIIIIWYNRI